MSIIDKRHREEHLHLSDEDVLRFADGELPPKRVAEVREHFDACWECRTRLMDFQNTIADFIRFQHASFDQSIPPIAGRLAQLRLKLRAQVDLQNISPNSGTNFSRLWTLGIAAALALLCMLSIIVKRFAFGGDASTHHQPTALSSAKPIPVFTPGEALQVSAQQVCSSQTHENGRLLPAELRKRVLEQYGMSNARPQDFELDYLITPDLGGAGSVKNLWPEPYYNTIWNARVKDQLEIRLKDLVCSGKIDLSTAQHELASDWIGAYKRYFNTEQPIMPTRRPAVLVVLYPPPSRQ